MITDILADGMFVDGVGMLPDVILGIGMDMLAGIGITVVSTPVITSEFVVGVADAGDVLADVLAVLIVDVGSAIDVDMLADENRNGWAAVMTGLALPV